MPLHSISKGDLDKVWEIRTLKKEKDDVARRLLEMAAKQVQPIMRKRKWQVKLLSEFCPRNPGLLGLNIDQGREVRVRLRPYGRENEFFPYESVLGTLLHELVHNDCGPHDAKFYGLLDVITKECEELMAKGISGTGQGFDARGQRLGGYTLNPPPTNMRAVALAAAEKRAKAASFMPSGPQRLGGDSEIMRALSPLQAAAMAAERRLRDDVWCAAPTTTGGDGLEKAKEREDSTCAHPLGHTPTDTEPSKVSVVDLTLSDSGDSSREGGRISTGDFGGTTKRSSSSAVSVDPVREASIVRAQKKGRSNNLSTSDRLIVERDTISGVSEWPCSVCTLYNTSLALACAACGNRKEQPTSTKEWSCKFCTLANSDLLDTCEACGQWRYSYGAPSATRAPNVGT
ncbi:uncharacterized protein [Physcomitrium patens]|uniref:WLM domain-containing protein n=1 Tax=Physcomitrium patens TaxID=3218 RepID=A0A2K1KIB1_PHYPA|nr:uncharacterized protein LOC112282321 [Physcomitrium patens]PNR53508.1 hypothetical protein PHYPA_007183 [Physcomitrium patens]|eukprot:XP_024375543.1 uncharacterized protein LOC112282321 [Physcomitrella patens]